MFHGRFHAFVDSHKRASGTNSDFTHKIDLPNRKLNRVVVMSISIDKSYYLVEAGKNTFILEEEIAPGPAVQSTVTVKPGNFNYRSFMVIVSAALTAASAATGMTWTYSMSYPAALTEPDTGFFTYRCASSPAIQPKLIFDTYLHEACGFDKNSTNQMVGDLIASTNVIKLQREDTIRVNSDICATPGTTSSLQMVYATTSDTMTAMLYHQENPYANALVLASADTPSNIYRFFLTDEDDVAIDLHGRNWVMTLLFFYDELAEVMHMFRNFLQLSFVKDSLAEQLKEEERAAKEKTQAAAAALPIAAPPEKRKREEQQPATTTTPKTKTKWPVALPKK